MRRTDPFPALIIAGFGIATYVDGRLWLSGFSAGLALAMIFEFVMTTIREDGR